MAKSKPKKRIRKVKAAVVIPEPETVPVVVPIEKTTTSTWQKFVAWLSQ